MCEEQRQLLGTEEDSSDRQSDCDGETAAVGAAGGVVTSCTAEEDVWEVTDEQRDYYRAQFLSLQPDCHGLLPGTVARAFFEKSKLPVTELRKIWFVFFLFYFFIIITPEQIFIFCCNFFFS